MTAPRHSDSEPPLDREERALAQRLARLGPRGEPSPALDARMLAAARAALDADVRPQRSRWPLALGVAASLTLAVGIAWQLRPLPAAIPVYDEDAAAIRAAAPSTAEAGADAGTQRRNREAAAEPTAAPASAAAGTAETATGIPARPATPPSAPPEPLRSVAPPQPVPVPAPQPPAPAPVVFDDPSPIDTYASPAPPPPVEPVAAPRAFPPAAEATATTEQASDARPAPPRTFAPPAQAERERRARAEAGRASEVRAAEARTTKAASTARVASDDHGFADTAQARLDWLQRIRELRDTGRLDDARASLRAFRARYPDYPLADDLQALAR